MKEVLSIKNLSVEYHTYDGRAQAVNNLNLEVFKGESLGLVGETGAGKTTAALSIMRLLPQTAKITGGNIEFNGQSMFDFNESNMNKIRGNQISMIFQDPLTFLNPVFTIGAQIGNILEFHQKLDKAEINNKSGEMLELVGIPRDRANEYPHQFSGGMRQRVGIAMALSCNPELLIADEPTTALDVTIQAQVLYLLEELKKQFNMSVIMITHNLGIVAETCDRVAVMYAGEIVEVGSVKDVFNNPLHPYTIGLFNSLPDLENRVERLRSIPGNMPDPMNLPQGCKFFPRCEISGPECAQRPSLMEYDANHRVACFKVPFGEVSE